MTDSNHRFADHIVRGFALNHGCLRRSRALTFSLLSGAKRPAQSIEITERDRKMLEVLRAVDVELALGLAAEIVVAEFDVAAEIVAEQVVGRIVHSS